MERVVRQKNYQINQRSLALTGRFAIDNYAAVEQATLTAKASPHKTIIIPIQKAGEPSPPKEFKKTQVSVCNISPYALIG